MGIVPLLSPAEAGETEDVFLDQATVDNAAVHAAVFVKEILDRINAVFHKVADIFDIFQLVRLAAGGDLMRDARIVDLINIAILDRITVATAVDLNAVAVAGDTSAATLGVVRVGTRIVLYRSTDPADLTAFNAEISRCSR